MVPKTSRAFVLTGERRMEERTFPMPDHGPDGGWVRVEGTGICSADWNYYTSGRGWHHAPPGPQILGHEIVGVVESIGEICAELHGVQVGDRIVLEEPIPCGHCIHCRIGRYQRCAGKRYGGTHIDTWPTLYGGYAEYVYLDPNAVVYKMSKDIPIEQAPLFMPIANGLRWVGIEGGAKAGDNVVIMGPGQQGLGGVIGAKEAGADKIIVIGMTGDAKRLEVAKVLGATHVVYADEEDVEARVSEITNGQMAKTVLDVSGSIQALPQALKLAGYDATIVTATAGGRVGPLENWEGMHMIRKELTIKGVNGREIETVLPTIRLMESGKYPLELLCSHTFPLSQAEEAIQTVGAHMEKGAIHVTVINE